MDQGAEKEKREELPLRRLARLLDAPRSGKAWSDADLLELPRLYRHACSQLARLEGSGENPRTLHAARALVARAHAVLHGTKPARAASWKATVVSWMPYTFERRSSP